MRREIIDVRAAKVQPLILQMRKLRGREVIVHPGGPLVRWQHWE